MCKNCKIKSVIKLNSGDSLCRNCFIKYFEKKARKTISVFRLLDKKDKVAVGLSGGKDSTSVLFIMSGLAKRNRGMEVVAISIDEGIKGYRDTTLKEAKAICKRLGVKHHIYSFRKEFGCSLDEMVKKLKMNPCTICGVFRRYLLNKYARKLEACKMVTGHNMDDEAQSIIMNQFRSNVEGSARLGPMTGVVSNPKFVRRIKPFYLLSEKEVLLYSFLKKLPFSSVECPYSHEAYRSEVRDMLNDFENWHPGVKNNVISSFLAILPLLKNSFRGDGRNIRSCKFCKEPTSNMVCKACELLAQLEK